MARFLHDSHDKESRLIKKFGDLKHDITVNAARVQSILKLTHDDSQTIQYLKTELQNALTALQLSKEREDKNKTKIENLQAEIKHLNDRLEEENKLKSGQTSMLQELKTKKEQLLIEREEQTNILAEHKSNIARLYELRQRLEQEKLTAETEEKGFRKQLMEAEEKQLKDNERKKKIVDEISVVKRNHLESLKENETIAESKRAIIVENDNLSQAIENRDTENDGLEKNIKKLREEYDDLKISSDEISQKKAINLRNRAECDKALNRLKLEINMKKSHNSQIEKNIDKLKNDIRNNSQLKESANKAKEIVISTVSHLEKELDDTNKFSKEDLKMMEELRRERDNLNMILNKIEKEYKEGEESLEDYDRIIKDRESEIQHLSEELGTMDKKANSLEKEKDKYGIQAAQANSKFFQSLEEIKLKDNLISEFQKKNAETESKLRQQQNLYEAVRSDRNLYSKQLTETQDEIAETKRRYKIVMHQINQLKEEIEAKEVALAKENFEHKRKDKTIESQSRDLEKVKKEIESKEEKIKNLAGEISKLHFMIKESEMQRLELKKDYEKVVEARDIFGTQLIRRNDELALIYEKIKIQQNTLTKGESAYRDRINDIYLLDIKIKDLHREKKIEFKKEKEVPIVLEKIQEIEKNLLQEKLKVKALSEELENPMNLERFRNLKGNDPDSYEINAKIQSLQRRLIQKTEQVVENEIIIQQKEKNIQELRELMKQQPGVEEAKRLSELNQKLKKKTRVLKSMAAEINMLQAQINGDNFEVVRLRKDINEMKRKYFELKRRLQLMKEIEEGQFDEDNVVVE